MNNNNNYMSMEDLLEQMRKYETLYDKVEEFGLENEVYENRYGRTNDEIITKNLLILCPDADYEMSKGKTSIEILKWLQVYISYVDTLFDNIYKRCDIEVKKIRNEEEKRIKSGEIEEKIRELPEDIRSKIRDYVPKKERGIGIMETSWCDIKSSLRKMKVENIKELVKYLKEKICREIIRERKGTSRELRNISDIIYQRQSTTKDELINMIEIIISRLLNVEIRNKEHRKVVEEKGYELIVLMNVIVKKNREDREEIEKIRKDLKREKRRERIRREKAERLNK